MHRQRFRSGRIQGIVTDAMLYGQSLMNVPTIGSAFGPDSELLI